jgi:hypothetical protein
MFDYATEVPPISEKCTELIHRMLTDVSPDTVTTKEDGENMTITAATGIPFGDDGFDNVQMDSTNAPSVTTIHASAEVISAQPDSSIGNERAMPGSRNLTQLTVNEYLPGQGIAQHIGKTSDRGRTSKLLFS